MLEAFERWGFEVDEHVRVYDTIDGILEFYRLMEAVRRNLPFAIDGIVAKVDDLELCDRLGSTAHAPRWAIAYKFSSDEAVTTVLDIVAQVGRTGIVTPVAVVEPVEIGGATVERATLHTADLVRKKDIRIGDRVTIRRAGEVIPEITGPVVDLRTGAERVFVMPDRCPVCGTALERDGAYVVCSNVACPAQIEGRIVHLASRRAFDIRGLGNATVRQLIDERLVANPANVFRLTEDELTALAGWGEKRSRSLLDEIETHRRVSFPSFLYALSIRGVGYRTAELIAERFGDLDRLLGASEEAIAAIDGVGPVVAATIVRFLSENGDLIDAMLAAGVRIVPTVRTTS